MSSSFGTPRAAPFLHLGQDSVRLAVPGEPDIVRDIGSGGADYHRALEALAAVCDGPVTAVLPVAAFGVRTVDDSPLGRMMGRRALAQELRAGITDLQVRALPPDGSGQVRLVALPGRVLRETVAFVESCGFTVAAVAAPGALTAGHRALFGLRPDDGAGRAGAPVGAVASLRGPVRGRRAAGAAALAGAGLLALAISVGLGSDRDDEARFTGLPPIPLVEPAPVPGEAPAGAVSPVAAAAPRVAADPAPALAAPRPRSRPFVAVARAEPPQARSPLPAALAAAGTVEGASPATMISRSVPPEIREAALAAVATARAARAAGSPQVATVGPVPRPRPQSVAPAFTEANDAALRPVPRPGAVEAPQAALSDGAADGRPRPRPADESQQLGLDVLAALAAAEQALPATGGATGPRPEPRRISPPPAVPRATPAAQVASAAPPPPAATQVAPPRAAVPAQQFVPAAAQPATRAQPAPVQQVARVQPAPAQQVARAEPPRQAAPAAPASGGSGTVQLIGVFGTSSQRHALVQLPGGAVQRVRPGEVVNGVQIAAVGADSVRVRVNGQDGVLRLPQ